MRSTTGRHRLLVAVDRDHVVGYAGSHPFRTKAAYDTTVETTVYCSPSALGRGIGRQLYLALFQTIEAEDIHSMLAAITLPLGYTSGKEYAELEWPIDLLIAVVWVAYA